MHVDFDSILGGGGSEAPSANWVRGVCVFITTQGRAFGVHSLCGHGPYVVAAKGFVCEILGVESAGPKPLSLGKDGFKLPIFAGRTFLLFTSWHLEVESQTLPHATPQP